VAQKKRRNVRVPAPIHCACQSFVESKPSSRSRFAPRGNFSTASHARTFQKTCCDDFNSCRRSNLDCFIQINLAAVPQSPLFYPATPGLRPREPDTRLPVAALRRLQNPAQARWGRSTPGGLTQCSQARFPAVIATPGKAAQNRLETRSRY